MASSSQSQNIGNIGGAGGGGGGSSSSTTTTPAATTTALLPSSSTSTSSSLLSPSSTAPNVQSSQMFSTPPQQQQQQQQQKSGNNFEPLDKSSSNTLKRNPKMELSKTDLLKLLGYLEGELQARDIVIAALKSEKMKHLLNSRYRSGTTDPQAALTRDVAIVGGVIRMECSQADRQVASLEAQCRMAKVTQCRMAKVLKEAEMRHRTVIKELEEEKRKHEHDTAQGDDITYGLEKERTRLKKELELERQEKKRLEIELKEETVNLEMEKSRKKQIVLLLLAERKKILMKYIEERKRSEDLAQILSEEKVRIDSMAEGLEEESKKSLQMEAELEKQLAQFDIERQQYRQAILKEEKKTKEYEIEIERIKIELESWKNGGITRSATGIIRAPIGSTPPPPPAKPANLTGITTMRPTGASQALKGPGVLGTGTPMVSSKVVQPTATVSSVPVSGPTTGIARSVTPRQAMRGVTYGSAVAPAVTTISNDTATTTTTTTTATVAPNTGGTTTVASSVVDTTNTTTTEPQTTDKRNVPKDGKLSSSSSSSSASLSSCSSTSTTTTTTTTATSGASTFGQTAVAITAAIAAKKPLIPRGIPPPVPPNKPIVPPKKEGAPYMRRPDQIQDAKLIKSPCQTTVANQVQAISSIPSHQITEEAKPR